MPGRFSTGVTVTGPAIGAQAITPSATELPEPIRMVTVGTSGVLVYTSSLDGVDYTTGILPVGSYPVFASHILAATTASDITGWT